MEEAPAVAGPLCSEVIAADQGGLIGGGGGEQVSALEFAGMHAGHEGEFISA